MRLYVQNIRTRTMDKKEARRSLRSYIFLRYIVHALYEFRIHHRVRKDLKQCS